MKRYTKKINLIFMILASMVLINIYYDNFILLFDIKVNDLSELFFKMGSSITQIVVIVWASYLCKKLLFKYKQKGSQYRRLIDLSPEAIIIHRGEEILYINQAGVQLLGANSRVQMLKYGLKEIIHPDYYDQFQSIEQEYLSNQSFKAKRLDGVIIDLEIISTSIEFGGKHAREIIAKDVTDRIRSEAIIKRFAYHDDLTGLPNRRYFMKTINKLVMNTEKGNNEFAIMFIDLDGFKQINDTFGHECGDYVLRQIGEYLKGCIREKDTVARLGGDEFTILLPNTTENESALVAKRIIERFDSLRFASSMYSKVTPSIGIALYPENGNDVEELMSQADYAMYQVKQHGKNGYKFVSISDFSMK